MPQSQSQVTAVSSRMRNVGGTYSSTKQPRLHDPLPDLSGLVDFNVSALPSALPSALKGAHETSVMRSMNGGSRVRDDGSRHLWCTAGNPNKRLGQHKPTVAFVYACHSAV